MRRRNIRKAMMAALTVTMSLSLYTAPVFAEENINTDEAVNYEESISEEAAVDMETEEAVAAEEDAAAMEETADDIANADQTADELNNSGVDGEIKWNYDTASKTLTVSSNTGKPATMKDYLSEATDYKRAPWDGWLKQCEHIVITDDVTNIGKDAFESYTSCLQTLTIGKGVKSIGEDAFWNGYGRDIDNKGNQVQTLAIPGNVKTIGEGAFSGWNNVKNIQIEEGVQTIGKRAFQYLAAGDISLYSEHWEIDLELPDSVQVIGELAFEDARIRSVVLPNSLKKIESYSFNVYGDIQKFVISKNVSEIAIDAFGCCTIQELDVDEQNPYFSVENGMIYNKDKTILYMSTRKKKEGDAEPGTITLPSGLRKVSAYALSGCAYDVSWTGQEATRRMPDIRFKGNAPEFDKQAFVGGRRLVRRNNEWTEEPMPLCGTAYYPVNDSTWTADKLQNYGGQVTWTAYEPTVSKGYCSLNDEGGKWDGTHYYLPDGSMVVNSFFFDGEYTYYLQADGTPMKDRLTYHPDGEHIIYLDENGHEAFTNFVYCTSVGYICYFGSDGYLYKDQITFVGDKTYYLNANGAMEQNGWFQFANGLDYGFANSDGTLVTTGFSYDPYGRVVFYHWNGMVARGLISDGVYYYSMDETDGHYLGQFPVNQ